MRLRDWLRLLFAPRRPIVVVPAPRPAPDPDPEIHPEPSGFDRATPGVLGLINRHRDIPLQWDQRLARAALAHSRDHAARRRRGHDGSDGSDFDLRVRREAPGLFALGECVARGHRSEADVVDGWRGSPRHLAILLDRDARLLGVAVAHSPEGDTYWTAVTA